MTVWEHTLYASQEALKIEPWTRSYSKHHMGYAVGTEHAVCNMMNGSCIGSIS